MSKKERINKKYGLLPLKIAESDQIHSLLALTMIAPAITTGWLEIVETTNNSAIITGWLEIVEATNKSATSIQDLFHNT
jgi:hypothetical protein